MPMPDAPDPKFFEDFWGWLFAAVGGLAVAVRQLTKRRKAKAEEEPVWADRIVEALNRNTAAIERLIDSNREAHDLTRQELRSVNDATRNAIAGLLRSMSEMLATTAAGVQALLTKALMNGNGK